MFPNENNEKANVIIRCRAILWLFINTIGFIFLPIIAFIWAMTSRDI